MQNDIVRQPPAPDQPQAVPQNTVSEVHVQPGTENVAPPIEPAAVPVAEAPADQDSSQPPETATNEELVVQETANTHKKSPSTKPMGAIIGAVVVCLSLVGLAVYAQLSVKDAVTTGAPVTRVAPAENTTDSTVSADIDEALADTDADTPSSDMSAELSETTLGL